MDVATLNKKFKIFRIDSNDDKSTISTVSENVEEDSEEKDRTVFTEEEILFNKQIIEYEKYQYEQISTEFDDSDEEIIGYDSFEEDSRHSGYNSQYEENEEDDSDDL